MKVLISDISGVKTGRAMIAMVKKMALTTLRALNLMGFELSLCFIDDNGIRALNKRYRGKDKPTDVLSFCIADEVLLGDVVISIDRACAQAEEAGCGLDEELARLVIHGVLHLVGFDHVRGGTQARKMKIKEAELIGLLRESGLIGSYVDNLWNGVGKKLKSKGAAPVEIRKAVRDVRKGRR